MLRLGERQEAHTMAVENGGYYAAVHDAWEGAVARRYRQAGLQAARDAVAIQL